MNYLYLYLTAGCVITIISFVTHSRKEKDISEIVHDKLHELRDDGSFSFQSANILGHLFAFIFSIIFWPILVLKKLLGK
jgi:hypothetical protein